MRSLQLIHASASVSMALASQEDYDEAGILGVELG